MAERIVVYPGSFNPLPMATPIWLSAPSPFSIMWFSNRHVCSKDPAVR